MAGFQPTDPRFCQEWDFLAGQGELNPHVLAGAERNNGTQGHAPFADVYGLASNLRQGSSYDENGEGDGAPEIAPPLSQYQPVSRLEREADGLRRNRSLKDKSRPLSESCCSLSIIAADGKPHSGSVRGGPMDRVQHASGLFSQLQINDHGIKFSALQ